MLSETRHARLLDALGHLYDYQYLRRHAVRSLFPAAELDDTGRSVQAALTAAVDRLKPPADVPPTAAAWRLYHILFYRFVQAMSVSEVANRIGVGPRHLKREQQRAVDALLELLLQNVPDAGRGQVAAPAPEAAVTTGIEEGVREEISRLQMGERGAIALAQTVSDALATVERPLAGRRIEVQVDLPEDLPAVGAHAALLRQAVISALGYFLQGRADGVLRIGALLRGEAEVGLAFVWQGRPAIIGKDSGTGAQADAQVAVLKELLASCGGWLACEPAGAPGTLTLWLPAAEIVPILVVEDNPDTVLLYRRYLAGTAYRMHVATGATVRRAVSEVRPAAIVLDIMMPEHDGWEVLIDLRHDPATADIPILVCSVLADSDIALGLGASAYHKKPITREVLLALLGQLVAGASAGLR